LHNELDYLIFGVGSEGLIISGYDYVHLNKFDHNGFAKKIQSKT